MSEYLENILIEVSPGEMRVAFADDQGVLKELLIERVNERSLLEGVYHGRVIRIEKGIGAAFVDIGSGENVFLDRATGLHEGQMVIVQVSRDAAAGKGASVRRRIALAGRFMVYTPGGEGLHWPRALKSGRKRSEFESHLAGCVQEDEGWALRSQASFAETDQLDTDMTALRDQWSEAIGKAENAPQCLLPPPGMITRVLRDRADGGTILVDDRETFLRLKNGIGRSIPTLGGALEFHDDPEPMFDAYGISDQLDALTERTIDLARGARLTFDATEALTVIDVDMGAAGGRARTDDAILATNSMAATEIARQIRLRNLAGLIVVDFITMRRKDHRRKLVEVLKRGFKNSTVPVDVLGVTAAGLMEITRRRDGRSIREILTKVDSREPQLSRESLLCAALREVLRARGAGRFRIVAEPGIAELLEGDFKAAFDDTCRRMGGALTVEADAREVKYRIEAEGRRR